MGGWFMENPNKKMDDLRLPMFFLQPGRPWESQPPELHRPPHILVEDFPSPAINSCGYPSIFMTLPVIPIGKPLANRPFFRS
jgi:hypothetical protein